MLPDLWLDATETYAKSKIACDFDGSNDRMRIEPVNTGTRFDEDDAFSGWCWISKDFTSGRAVISDYASPTGWFFNPGLNDSNAYLELRDTAGKRLTVTFSGVTGQSTGNTNIYFFAFTYDGSSSSSGVKLYYGNSSNVLTDVTGSATNDLLDGTGIINTSSALAVGSFWNTTTQHAGVIDQVGLSSGVLTTDELALIYNSNAGLNYRDLDGTETFYSNIVAWYDMNVPTNFGRNYASDKHAVNLAGTQRLTKTGQPFLLNSDDSWSCAMWVNFNAIGTNGQLMNEARATNVGWSLLTASNKLTFQMGTDNVDRLIATGSTAMSTLIGSWHHVGMSYDGTDVFTGVKLYIDGVAETVSGSQARTSPTNNDLVLDGSVPFNIGYGGIGAMNGAVDQASLYTGVLTEANFLTLTNSGVPLLYADTIQTNLVGFWDLQIQTLDATVVDSVGTNNLTPFSLAQADLVGGVGSLDLLETGIDKNNAVLGHVSGNASGYDGVTKWTDRGTQGNDATQATIVDVPMWIENGLNTTEDYVEFNGTDDYLNTPNVTGADGVTNPSCSFSYLIWRDAAGNHNLYDSGGTNTLKIQVFANNIYLTANVGGNVIEGTWNGGVSDYNSWHHIAVTWGGGDSTTMKFYYDGSLITKSASQDQHTSPVSASSTQAIMAKVGGGFPLNGRVAQCKVFQTELTEANILTIMAYYNEKYGLTLGA